MRAVEHGREYGEGLHTYFLSAEISTALVLLLWPRTGSSTAAGVKLLGGDPNGVGEQRCQPRMRIDGKGEGTGESHGLLEGSVERSGKKSRANRDLAPGRSPAFLRREVEDGWGRCQAGPDVSVGGRKGKDAGLAWAVLLVARERVREEGGTGLRPTKQRGKRFFSFFLFFCLFSFLLFPKPISDTLKTIFKSV